MLTSNNRQIKLQPKHRDQSGNHTVVPGLNISGVWLEKLGFKVEIWYVTEIGANSYVWL